MDIVAAMRAYFLEPAEMKTYNKDTRKWESSAVPLMPTPEGFLVSVDMTPEEFAVECEDPLVQRMANMCKLACKDYAVKHGLSGAYNSSVWDKYMRNEHDYKDKIEVINTHTLVLTDADKRMLERAGVLTLDAQ